MPVRFQFENEADFLAALRDWFAGRVEVPWNAVIETLSIRGNKYPTVGEMAAYRAELKYLEADAMLARRKAGA